MYCRPIRSRRSSTLPTLPLALSRSLVLNYSLSANNMRKPISEQSNPGDVYEYDPFLLLEGETIFPERRPTDAMRILVM